MARRDRSVIRSVIRKGGLEPLFLQPAGHWGNLATARRFSSDDKAEKFATKAGIGDDYGIFPAGPRRPIKWPREMQMEAHKMGWDLFINTGDGKFYLEALTDPQGIAEEAAQYHGLNPDDHPYAGPNFYVENRHSDPRLGPDNLAMKFVIEQAKGGNNICRQAIDFLIDRNSPDAKEHDLVNARTW